MIKADETIQPTDNEYSDKHLRRKRNPCENKLRTRFTKEVNFFFSREFDIHSGLAVQTQFHPLWMASYLFANVNLPKKLQTPNERVGKPSLCRMMRVQARLAGKEHEAKNTEQSSKQTKFETREREFRIVNARSTE